MRKTLTRATLARIKKTAKQSASRLLRPLARVGTLFKDAAAGWQRHNVNRMAAAISYYGIFSLAPMLVIMMTVAGLLFGKDATEGLIVGRLTESFGLDNARFVQAMLAGAYSSRGQAVATVLAALLLVWTATRVIGSVRGALNDIWGVQARGGGGLLGFALGKLIDLGMVLGIGFMFLASMLANTAVSAVTRYFSDHLPVPGWALQGAGVVFSLVVITLFLAIIFRVLPNITARWRDILVGTSCTAIFFTVGNYLLGRYLGRATPASVFGAAGSLAVIMIWIYYSTQIVLFGAELTRAYAARHHRLPARAGASA